MFLILIGLIIRIAKFGSETTDGSDKLNADKSN